MKLHSDPAEGLPQLDMDQANAIIANVFSSCEREPNTIPLETLSSYAEYRRERYSLQKGIIIGMLVIFLLLPLCFIAPKFTVQEIARSETGIPTYEVTVDSLLPVRLASAKLNGSSIAVYESAAGVYTVEPSENGTLDLSVMLMNRQSDSDTIEVTGIDATAPTLVSSEVIGKNLRIYVQDNENGVGVDYAGAYALSTADAHQILPADFSEAEGYVEFLFDQNMNIFIPDLNGNTLQLVLTVGG